MRLFSLIVCLCIVYARAYTRSLFQVNGAEDLPSAQCPSSPNDRQLELGEVSAACNPEDDDYCAKCSCALFTAFKPELRAAGLFELPDGEADQEALMQAVTEGAAVITQCIQDFIPQFLANGIPIQALASLADCTFAGGSAPQCLVNRVSEEIPEEVGPGVTGGTSGPQGKPGNSGSSSSSSSSSSGGGGGPSGSGSKEEESNNQSKGSADEFAEDTPQDVEDDVKDAVGGSNAPEKEDAAQGPDGANKSGNEENSNEGTAIGGDGTPVTPPESSNGPANSSPPNGSTGGSGSTPSPADNSGGSARSPSPGGGSEASPNPSGAGGKGKDGEGTSPPPSSSDGSSSAMSLSLLALSAAAAALLLAC